MTCTYFIDQFVNSTGKFYQALSGNDSKIQFSSQDFSDVLQSAITNNPISNDINSIYVTGNCILTKQVNVTSNTKLYGDAEITADASLVNSMLFLPQGTTSVEISDLTLNANNLERSNSSGKNIITALGQVSKIYIHDNTLINSPWVAIGFSYAEMSFGPIYNLKIINNIINNTFSDAIFIAHASNLEVSHNSINHIGDSGIVFSNSTTNGIINANNIQESGLTTGGQGIAVVGDDTSGISITSNNVNCNKVPNNRGIVIGWGDELNGINGITVSGNTVYNSTTYLLFLSKCRNIAVMSNQFLNTSGSAVEEVNTVLGNNSYINNIIFSGGNDRSIKIFGKNTTFMGNTVTSYTGYETGITIYGSSDYNTISGNRICGYEYGIVVFTNNNTAIFSNDLRGCLNPIVSDAKLSQRNNLADTGWLPEQ
jgi:hypothetical protein